MLFTSKLLYDDDASFSSKIIKMHFYKSSVSYLLKKLFSLLYLLIFITWNVKLIWKRVLCKIIFSRDQETPEYASDYCIIWVKPKKLYVINSSQIMLKFRFSIISTILCL